MGVEACKMSVASALGGLYEVDREGGGSWPWRGRRVDQSFLDGYIVGFSLDVGWYWAVVIL